MNYHEALQNPHFKKIWEKVIMNRHPEAKTLEEALANEIKCQLCFYELFGRIDLTTKNIDTEWHGSVKILGRLITLDDILILLKEIDMRNYVIGKKTNNVSFYRSGLEKCFDWQLTKPLHEQDPKTWKAIVKIMSY